MSSREAEPGRAAEYRPADDASVLGRVLSLLGGRCAGAWSLSRIIDVQGRWQLSDE